MKKKDIELIRRTLNGEDTAFTQLVRKYQKPVHALVWRKIGDFHIAEEITQDTFLKAYQNLATLKEPQRFSSWLYVIATRRCVAWLRKKRLWTQALEETNIAQLEKATYSGYVVEENERVSAEAQREVVKKLLAKLQESERTIMTLHYFGEMSSAEIGEFLGVSANTVRSRLHRAQQRLKKEEPMIREALDSFRLSANLTENIMREIGRVKPIAPSGGKPLVPWVIAASTIAVMFLMIGFGNRYLSRFQKPYSFDATSEMTVELIEAPVVLSLESKPDIQHQFGNSNTKNKKDGLGQRPNQSEHLARFAAAPVDEAPEIIDTNKGKRYITLSAITKEKSGTSLAAGNFHLKKTDLALTSRSYATSGTGKGDPNPMYMLTYYIFRHNTDLFRFPLVIGDTWAQEGHWNAWGQTTIEGYEQVEVAAGTFRDCLKHKTVFTGADAGSSLKSSLVNGTRYLWFANGVGVVKIRYEHANGITTEAELLTYKVAVEDPEYLPLQVGNAWTFKWQNDYRDEASIEVCQVVENSDQLSGGDTTPPEVARIIPDLSAKVSTDLREISVVFSERMIGMDVEFAGVPIGDMQWTNDNTTFIISFERPLESSKIYRLILGGEGNIRDIAGNPLEEEYTLTFTTEGPEPATPTFTDTTPVHVKGIEKLDLSSELLCRVSTDLTDGFAFPYYLLVPQGIDFNRPVHLLVEPCNTGPVRSFKSLERKTKALAAKSHATAIARELKIPLLVPVFPRPGGDRWQIYTHALDRDTLLIQEGELRRIDLQLIKMIAHAQKLLRHNNMKVNEKVFMNGFSASGTFTNRFAILHPTVVRAVATGGVNGIPTFPTDRWNDTTLRYPVGIADLKEIADVEFDETAYKRVSQYIYMGALDDNDTIPYRDAFDAVDAKLVESLIGTKMMPDRWRVSQLIYQALGIPAQFVTYEHAGHEITSEMIDDLVAFFKANSGNEIVEIVPHPYLLDE